MLLAATAMAVLLTGCHRTQQDGSSSQDGSNSQDGSSLQQQSEVANIASVGACTSSSGADRAQKGLGEASNGKIAFQRFPPSGESALYRQLYIIDEDGTNKTRLTSNVLRHQIPDWSPDGQNPNICR